MKDKFIKSTIILLVGGCCCKILGMIIKILMGRLLGPDVLGLYMLILPAFSLFIGIGQFGLPFALSKLVADDNRDNKRLFFSVIPISIVVNLVLMALIFMLAPFLAEKFLHSKETYYGLVSIAVVIPFISISGICRSYFFGKGRVGVHVFSNIVEDIVRLLVIAFGGAIFKEMSKAGIVCFLILSNVISETASIIVLLLFLPKKFSIRKSDIKPKFNYIKDSLSIGIPNTCGRLIGSVGYFLEPILLMSSMIKAGYSQNFVTREYGILSGFVMPILLLPSFFTSGISQALLPDLAKNFTKKNITNIKKKLKLGITFSLIIGTICMSFFVIFPDLFLKIIYKSNRGGNYMRFLAPICLLQYIQSPLAMCLESCGKSKLVMISNILGMITRCLLVVVLSTFRIGLWGLIFAISVNVFIITIYDLIMVKRTLK